LRDEDSPDLELVPEMKWMDEYEWPQQEYSALPGWRDCQFAFEVLKFPGAVEHSLGAVGHFPYSQEP